MFRNVQKDFPIFSASIVAYFLFTPPLHVQPTMTVVDRAACSKMCAKARESPLHRRNLAMIFLRENFKIGKENTQTKTIDSVVPITWHNINIKHLSWVMSDSCHGSLHPQVGTDFHCFTMIHIVSTCHSKTMPSAVTTLRARVWFHLLKLDNRHRPVTSGAQSFLFLYKPPLEGRLKDFAKTLGDEQFSHLSVLMFVMIWRKSGYGPIHRLIWCWCFWIPNAMLSSLMAKCCVTKASIIGETSSWRGCCRGIATSPSRFNHRNREKPFWGCNYQLVKHTSSMDSDGLTDSPRTSSNPIF